MSYYADYLAAKCEEGWGQETDWMDFYCSIFDGGLPYGSKKFAKDTYLAILLTVGPKKNEIRKRLVDEDLVPLQSVIANPREGTTSFISPITYAGNSKSIKNARFMFAMCIEVDDLLEETAEDGTIRFTGLEHLIGEWERGAIPKPTYIVSSGNGIHLYYQFVEKLPMYTPNERKFMNMRRELSPMLWNAGLSTSKVQIQSTVQGYRVVGSITKSGKICRAFKVGERVTLEYLNGFLSEENRATDLQWGPKHCSRDYAKKHYPEWWAAQQEKKKKRKEEGPPHYIVSRAVYDNWKNRIEAEVEVGHRAGCMMTLAIYALKCGITEDELIRDIEYFTEYFDSLTIDENNHFTLEEGMAALKYYRNPEYYTYPNTSISYRSGIEIVPTERNFRSRAEHLKMCRELAATKTSKRDAVREWRLANPDGRKSDCVRATGISKRTVDKWWDICLDKRKKAPKRKRVKTKWCDCCGKEQPFERGTGVHYNSNNQHAYEDVIFKCAVCGQVVGKYGKKHPRTFDSDLEYLRWYELQYKQGFGLDGYLREDYKSKHPEDVRPVVDNGYIPPDVVEALIKKYGGQRQ